MQIFTVVPGAACLGSPFDPEDGNGTFFRNVSKLLSDQLVRQNIKLLSYFKTIGTSMNHVLSVSLVLAALNRMRSGFVRVH
jgi:hypothetical protein